MNEDQRPQNASEIEFPVAKGIDILNPLIPYWSGDVYVDSVTIEQADENGWHRVVAYVRLDQLDPGA